MWRRVLLIAVIGVVLGFTGLITFQGSASGPWVHDELSFTCRIACPK